ncbi:MAG: hypothetical protein ACKN9W_12805 [Methylococcus sp.]
MLNVSFWPDPWLFSGVEVTFKDYGIVFVESGDENPVSGNDAIQVGGTLLILFRKEKRHQFKQYMFFKCFTA